METKYTSWKCPMCSLVKLPYGTTCPNFHNRTCENMDKLNINGRFYLTEQLKEEKSIGIAAISDE